MRSLRQLGAVLLLVVLLPAIVVCLVVSRLFGFEWPADPDDLDGIACRRTWIEKRRVTG